jgi:hypothetical protein
MQLEEIYRGKRKKEGKESLKLRKEKQKQMRSPLKRALTITGLRYIIIREALGPNQSSIQWVSGAFPPV